MELSLRLLTQHDNMINATMLGLFRLFITGNFVKVL